MASHPPTLMPHEWNDPRYADAYELQGRVGLMDLHVDSIIWQRLLRYDVTASHRPGRWGQPRWNHADLPRMAEARYSAVCMGIHYWPVETHRGWIEAQRQIDYLDRIAASDERYYRVSSPADWAVAEQRGKIGIAPGVEGAHMLGGRLEVVEELSIRGVAYLTLAHFSRNSAAVPCMGRGANEEDGLTPFGRDVVRALNRHGVAVDVAHVNMPGVLDACATSERPVIATHAGARGVYPHPRMLSDKAIDAIAETGGTIGVIFAPSYMGPDKRAGSSVMIDHIRYIADRVGPAHISLGSDFDGFLPYMPTDMRDCRDAVKITHGLLEAGFNEEEVGGILYRNAIRVLSAAGG